MTYVAVKVPVIESERGWGSKTDDYMICLSADDARKFVNEFNSKNTGTTVPEWYMYAESQIQPIDISDKQFKFLKKNKRVWLSTLKQK